MTTTTSYKEPKNRKKNAVYVEQPEVFHTILVPEINSHRNTAASGGSGGLNQLSYNPSDSKSNQQSVNSRDFSTRLLIEQSKFERERTAIKTKVFIQRCVRNMEKTREAKFIKNTDNIEEARSILEQVDKDLSLQEESKRNKTRRQFEDWNHNIHGKIMTTISQQVKNRDYRELHKKRNDDFTKFLEITNKKAAIFRDTIIESEYDPLEPNRNTIKARVGKLIDPLKIDANKAEMEASMLGSVVVNHPKHTGRATLPVEQWATGKIEATPHGCFAKMMITNNRVYDDSSTKRTSVMNSSINFDHFNISKGKEVTYAEMPKGKRCVFMQTLPT